MVQGIFDELVDAGQAHGLKLAGYHALNSLRLEKGYRHWDDITDEDNLVEAGLSFTANLDKSGDSSGEKRCWRKRKP